MKKKRQKNNKIGSLKGFSIEFLPYSEIRNLDSDGRIKKVLGIVSKNNILILQGRLRAEEEARLIRDTMSMIGHAKNFKGVELAVVSSNSKEGFFARIKASLANMLSGGDLGAVTIIGPATVVKEIKKNPKKIELFLNR